MTPERLARIEQLFHAVREQAAEARESYLDAECAEDVELRGEVLSLLRTEEGQAIKTGGAVAAAQLSGPGAQSGGQLGPYRLGELLGAGGMGEVYRARDAKLGRDVAIKILPSELGVDAGRPKQFEREAGFSQRSIIRISVPSTASRSKTVCTAWCWSSWTARRLRSA